MEYKIRFERYMLIASLIGLYIITLSCAFIVYRYSAIVTRGVLAIALIYLLFYYGKHSKIDISLDALLLAPNKGKYFVSALVGGLLVSWAILQIMETIFFLIERVGTF